MDARILGEFRAIVGKGLITEDSQLHTYECDGLTNMRILPQAVLLPSSTADVQAIVRICQREKIPFVARGSGTGRSRSTSGFPICSRTIARIVGF